MDVMSLARTAAAALLALTLPAVETQAQEGHPAPHDVRLAADAVVSSDVWIEHGGAESSTTLDLMGGGRVGAIEVVGRPVLRRDHEGEWHADIYQLAARYGRGHQVRWRVDAGYLPSPIGLSPLESRADVNPLIAPITAYTSRLPLFEGGTPQTQLATPLYPLAAQLTVSTTRWDARVAVLESSLVRVRPLTGDDKPPRAPQLALGAGISPRVGLRLGASIAHGRYARATETAAPGSPDRTATIVSADGDWSFGYTRLYGDFVRTSFTRAVAAPVVATALTVTGVQTLSPRWFVAGRAQRLSTSDRVESQSAPAYGHGYGHEYGSESGEEYGGHDSYGDSHDYGNDGDNGAETWISIGAAQALSLETVAGFRLTPAITLRAGYLGYRGYVDTALEHHATLSIVWARRW
jgi:hypothetical protein